MLLNVRDRLALLGLLPRQGDLTILRIVRDLERELSFTEEEHQKLNFRSEGDKLFWSVTSDYVKDVKLGPRALRLLQDALTDLEKRKELTFDLLPLYERLVEGETTSSALEEPKTEGGN